MGKEYNLIQEGWVAKPVPPFDIITKSGLDILLIKIGNRERRTRCFLTYSPALEEQRFWGQTATAGIARLTSPNPMVDAPSI